MATYKVIQDIEAEDKLLGPLTLRQFLYAAITVVTLYLCYFSISKHLLFLLVLFLPMALLSGFFAFPWARDQPTELWALAKVRYIFKPHIRIWDQSGIKQLVTVTAPKKPQINYTNNLSQTEVQSRLKALAETIDTRGWVTKNVNVNIYEPVGVPGILPSVNPPSDRLVPTTSLPQAVPDVDIRADEDVLDEENNPTAQHLATMITQREQEHHQELLDQAQGGTSPASSTAQQPQQAPSNAEPDYWFLNESERPKKNSAGYTTFGSRVVIPGTDLAVPQQGVANNSVAQGSDVPQIPQFNPGNPEANYSHLRRVQPLTDEDDIIEDKPATPRHAHSTKKKKSKEHEDRDREQNQYVENPNKIDTSMIHDRGEKSPVTDTPPAVTQPVDAAIMNLARDNNKNIQTLANEASQEASQVDQMEASNDEVIITLH